ncbi:outer membrane lipoprotein carrier protein LolA [Fulvivirgaceae bacterium BMA10]|uniref:Outer membrane lipoprotein carrier protein LolA n=1 Tax=Splendidivirga corallicola TaxID=3051826 RepID=A0ABT8KIU3_9BACT|nr:outer membrane lipoprotein carrier protein LolA [Fulvivirgaceae bacterium BMA10]
MKRILVFVLVICGMTNIALAQQDARAKGVLDAMSKKYQSIPSFKAKFSQILENDEESINEEFSGEITIKGQMFKLVMGEQEIFNNGTTQWTYLKEVNEVNIDTYEPEDGEINPTNIYNAYKEGYKYVYLEDQQEKGRSLAIIDLIPEDKSLQFFKIRMKIDKGDNSLKSWRMFDKNGNRYEYRITAFDSKFTASNNYFEFNPAKYPGVEVIDLR